MIDIDRDEGPGHSQPRLGAAVPRHGLQQPAAPAGRAGRHAPWSCRAFDVDGVPAHGRRRAHRPAHERARDLRTARWPSPTSPTLDLKSVQLDRLRRRADRARARPADPGGVPERPGRQRLRAHRDLLASPPSSPTSGRPSTPTRSASPRRSSTSRWTSPSTASASCWCAGRTSSSGYWNKPDATAATFVDGWLHTGDLARVDDDGLVRVVDRAKDMINRGGENVYCVEVENALAGAPGVAEAAVVGVPDDVLGEKVGAVIVPLPGQPFDGRGDGARLPGASASRTSRCRSTSRCGASRCRATPAARSSSGTCGTAPSGGRRCAELSPSRAAVHRFAECPRAAARRTTLQA